MTSLANLLLFQETYADAEPLCRECLESSRRTLGDTHPSTIDSVGKVARVLKSQGKYEEAEPLYRE